MVGRALQQFTLRDHRHLCCPPDTYPSLDVPSSRGQHHIFSVPLSARLQGCGQATAVRGPASQGDSGHAREAGRFRNARPLLQVTSSLIQPVLVDTGPLAASTPACLGDPCKESHHRRVKSGLLSPPPLRQAWVDPDGMSSRLLVTAQASESCQPVRTPGKGLRGDRHSVKCRAKFAISASGIGQQPARHTDSLGSRCGSGASAKSQQHRFALPTVHAAPLVRVLIVGGATPRASSASTPPRRSSAARGGCSAAFGLHAASCLSSLPSPGPAVARRCLATSLFTVDWSKSRMRAAALWLPA